VTKYIFNASELPGFYPIPQHCEMSFLRDPPQRLFFCCLVAPQSFGGETPLCDFRAVYRDLDPLVRSRFEQKESASFATTEARKAVADWTCGS
jgi:alpha-ketoglutarate-dependent taurine dioxygenase